MGTNFPTTLDTDTELYQVTDAVDDVLDHHHNNHTDALKAIESKVGVDGSTVNTSIDYHLGTAMFMQTATDATSSAATTSYTDLAGVTMSVVVLKTSSVLLTATFGNTVLVTGSNTLNAIIYWNNATESTSEYTDAWPASTDGATHGGFTMQVLKTGIVAGTYTFKVQGKTSASTGTFNLATLTAIVIPESL
jgi:hypothetical protein